MTYSEEANIKACDGYMSLEEAAAYLGLETVTLRILIRKDAIPACKTEDTYLLKRSEIEAWAKASSDTEHQ